MREEPTPLIHIDELMKFLTLAQQKDTSTEMCIVSHSPCMCVKRYNTDEKTQDIAII